MKRLEPLIQTSGVLKLRTKPEMRVKYVSHGFTRDHIFMGHGSRLKRDSVGPRLKLGEISYGSVHVWVVGFELNG